MKEGYTKKLYWGKWSHKAIILLGKVDGGKAETEVKVRAARKSFRAFLKKHLPECKTLSTSQWKQSYQTKVADGYYSYSGYHYVNVYEESLTVYFNDAAFLDVLKKDKTWGKALTYVEKPFNDAHVQALEVDKLVVRKTLWFDKYRYAARSKSFPATYTTIGGSWRLGPQPDVNAIMTWVDEQLIKELGRREGEDFKVSQTGYYQVAVNLYFKHANDAMMYRLAFGQQLKSTERIKLISELEETTSE